MKKEKESTRQLWTKRTDWHTHNCIARAPVWDNNNVKEETGNCYHYLFRLVCTRPIPKNMMTNMQENTGINTTAICLEILRYFSLFFVDAWLVYRNNLKIYVPFFEFSTSKVPHLLCSSTLLESNFCFICKEFVSSLKYI